MNKFSITISIFLTFFSTMVLAYISIATMIGPWIAPTLVLIAGFVLKMGQQSLKERLFHKDLALIQTVGSLGGIISTAVGFTLPMLYFLDRAQFCRLLDNPIYFCAIIALLCISGGSLGILLGRAFGDQILKKKELTFPVSHLIHKTITSQLQGEQTKQMFFGLSLTGLICFLRDGLHVGRFFTIPSVMQKWFLLDSSKTIFLFRSFIEKCRFLGESSIFCNAFPIKIMPMLWSIGFIAGTGIVFPLVIGMLSKYFVLYPLNNHAAYLPFKLFNVLDKKMFSMAFSSGLVLAGVVPSILKYPSIITKSIKKHSGYSFFKKVSPSMKERFFKCDPPQKFSTKIAKLLGSQNKFLKHFFNFEGLISILLTLFLFAYFNFPILSLVIVLPLTIISAYNITYIGCEIGLVPIGRFVLFVMLPTILLFKLSALQVTILCVFVGCCIVASSDLLFGYKIGELCDVSRKRVHRYQWLGLITTALCLGFFLWLLFTNLQLGSPELFAQRGRARALLIQSLNFNWTVLFLGLMYGLGLKKLKISPFMVFGGILMPNSLTLGLSFGALGTLFVKNKRRHLPFCSGVSAGESMWLIFSILTKAFH